MIKAKKLELKLQSHLIQPEIERIVAYQVEG